MMQIDAHHHVWDLRVREQAWTRDLPILCRSFLFAELKPLLLAHSFDATIVVQTECTSEESAELLALADAEAAIAGVVGWVDLTSPRVNDAIAMLRGGVGGEYLVGIRHQVQAESDPQWLCRDDVRRGLTAVADHGLVYEFVLTAEQLPAALATSTALDSLRFVLNHGGAPMIARGVVEPWRTLVNELAARPNVAVKLSGLATKADAERWTVDQLRPYADALLDTFGPRRVIFGSDWPVCLVAGSYEQIVYAARSLTSHLSGGEQASIFGGAAHKWYEL